MPNSAGVGETSSAATFFKTCRRFNDVSTHAMRGLKSSFQRFGFGTDAADESLFCDILMSRLTLLS